MAFILLAFVLGGDLETKPTREQREAEIYEELSPANKEWIRTEFAEWTASGNMRDVEAAQRTAREFRRKSTIPLTGPVVTRVVNEKPLLEPTAAEEEVAPFDEPVRKKRVSPVTQLPVRDPLRVGEVVRVETKQGYRVTYERAITESAGAVFFVVAEIDRERPLVVTVGMRGESKSWNEIDRGVLRLEHKKTEWRPGFFYGQNRKLGVEEVSIDLPGPAAGVFFNTPGNLRIGFGDVETALTQVERAELLENLSFHPDVKQSHADAIGAAENFVEENEAKK